MQKDVSLTTESLGVNISMTNDMDVTRKERINEVVYQDLFAACTLWLDAFDKDEDPKIG